MRWTATLLVMTTALLWPGRCMVAVRQQVGGYNRGRALYSTSSSSGGRASAAVKQQEKKEGTASSSAALDLQPPRGTRDFYPEDMRVRNWLFGMWRRTASRFGFEEYDAPVVENEALYVRKAGEEVTGQLYNFEDKGGRRLSLRPEMTPSLARMVMARRKQLALPLKWFSVPQCWRYERTTRGRRREHYQWNMDIWGVEGVEAEAEVLAAVVDFFRSVGLSSEDVGIKINSRAVLADVLSRVANIEPNTPTFVATCVLVDKLDKIPADKLYDDFRETSGMTPEQVDRLVDSLENSSFDALPPDGDLATLYSLAEAYGYSDWLVFDATVVRGLAYYTGTVFEAFDRSGELRAICGGGRYDQLLSSFGAADSIPAVGFGFGDAVVMELLESKGLVPDSAAAIDVVAYPFSSDDAEISKTLSKAAAAVATELRGKGFGVDLVLQGKKPKAAFKFADKRGARFVVMIAPDEWQNNQLVVVKQLDTGHQENVQLDDLGDFLANAVAAH